MAARQRGASGAACWREEDFDGHFHEARECYGELPSPFDVARTELAWGERLRRERRRTEARAQLTAALAGFDRLGARPWAARARAELAVAEGGRSRPAAADEAPLTHKEGEVADLVAAGATNREAAAALFLSPRTVEHHLRQVYRKLGVRSRTELAAAYGAREVTPRPPADRNRVGGLATSAAGVAASGHIRRRLWAVVDRARIGETTGFVDLRRREQHHRGERR